MGFAGLKGKDAAMQANQEIPRKTAVRSVT
jgi:hypothetical protein